MAKNLLGNGFEKKIFRKSYGYYNSRVKILKRNVVELLQKLNRYGWVEGTIVFRLDHEETRGEKENHTVSYLRLNVFTFPFWRKYKNTSALTCWINMGEHSHLKNVLECFPI